MTHKVIIYGTIETWEFDSWIIGFNKIYPDIKIEYSRKYVYGTPPPMSNQIKQDLSETGSSADIVFSAISPHLQMLNQDLFQVYDSKERRNISESFKERELKYLIDTAKLLEKSFIRISSKKNGSDFLCQMLQTRLV